MKPCDLCGKPVGRSKHYLLAERRPGPLTLKRMKRMPICAKCGRNMDRKAKVAMRLIREGRI